MSPRSARTALALLLALLLCGCSLLRHRAPPAPAAAARGAQIASVAAALVGAPYAFGGADVSGFDCSGLALYAHEHVGLAIPRTAAEQQRAAQPVPVAQLLPGDLVFFRMRGRRIDHVGVYIGEGRFVHAPHRGVAVTSADLSDAYYARHLVNAGRFWSSALSSS